MSTSDSDANGRHFEAMKHWRAWGSWFSWGSPVGLGLGYALFMTSTGVFLWLLSISGQM